MLPKHVGKTTFTDSKSCFALIVFLSMKIDFFTSSRLRSGSLEAESEMSCVKVIYPVFSRRKRMRNKIGEGKGAKQGFGFGWNLALA